MLPIKTLMSKGTTIGFSFFGVWQGGNFVRECKLLKNKKAAIGIEPMNKAFIICNPKKCLTNMKRQLLTTF